MKNFLKTIVYCLSAIVLLPIAVMMIFFVYVLVIDYDSVPKWYKQKSPAAQTFYHRLDSELAQQKKIISLQSLTDFDWNLVCYWGSYGISTDENLAAKLLGLDAETIEKYVYAEEGQETFLFKKPENIFVAIYINSSHDRKYAPIELQNYTHKPCFKKDEATFIVNK